MKMSIRRPVGQPVKVYNVEIRELEIREQGVLEKHDSQSGGCAFIICFRVTSTTIRTAWSASVSDSRCNKSLYDSSNRYSASRVFC